MARMLPRQIDADAPSSERRVFDLLRTDPDAKDWTVLHSLGLAKRGAKPYGEIDFVVLIPHRGIVCLEVKGGRVRCQDGQWYTRDRSNVESKMNKSPIMQARAGMFALRRAIQRHFGEASKEADATIACAVVFTSVQAPPAGVEAESWEFVDQRTLATRPISVALETILRLSRSRLSREGDVGPDSSVIAAIRAFLRPDFDLAVARSTTIASAEAQLVKLTQDQYDVVDSVELNERCLIEGAAGTGKTLIALQIARRALATGKRPILLCFNKLLGQWIEREFGGGVAVIGSYHRVLRRLIGSSSSANAFDVHVTDGRFEDWPGYAVEALSETGSLGDVLIVDEAQDLSTDDDMCVFDAMLEGGLAGGRWVMLGDFTRQAIFGTVSANKGHTGFEKTLRLRSPHFAALRLGTNCRNTRQIAEETAMLTGFENLPYRLSSAEGAPVDFRYWDTPKDEADALIGAIRELRRDGVAARDITLLSPLRFERSVATALVSSGQPVADLTGGSSKLQYDEILFSTIHAFKGMETSVGIMIDLQGIEDAARQAVLYVGMSRARSHLMMLVHRSFRGHVEETVRRRLHGAI